MRMIALQEFDYDAITRKPGDEFETKSNLHGQLLMHVGKAKEKQKGQIDNRAMQAKEEKPDDDKPMQSPRSSERRVYKRRDMRPED